MIPASRKTFGVLFAPLLWAGITWAELTLSGEVAVNAEIVPPPGGVFDLSHWKLTLPVDDTGGITGNAAEVKNPALQTYTSQFFHTGPDNEMIFWCPELGATTSSATAPRTELREQMIPGSSSSNWPAYGTHILRGECRVTQLPRTGAVIIGQAHGYPEQRLVKVQYDAGRVQAYVRTTLASGGDTKFTWIVPTNALLTYEIKITDGVASIAVNGVTNSHDFFADDPAWRGSTYYFKAGAYLQDNNGPATEGGRVSFQQLSVSHAAPATPPAFTIQPLSQTVATGGNVTLSAEATGTAPLNYQWRTNGVNLPGRTNASLPITGFRATDQRRYDVVAANVAGLATSAPAALYLNTPLRFTNSSFAGGRFRTYLLGVAGSNYVLQTSSNLTTWTALATNGAATGIVPFTNLTTSGPRRFYRAR